jgi:DNA-binding NarL/FixJ family response regulator
MTMANAKTSSHDRSGIMSTHTIRVVVADDQKLLREMLSSLLSLTTDIRVVAKASDGMDAVDAVLRTGADVGLFDVHMPNWGGLDAVRELHKRNSPVKTILLTAIDDNPTRKAAFQEGAEGFLPKDISLEELADTIRSVAAGNTVYQPLGDAHREVFPQMPEPVFVELTPRELQIVRLLARGLPNKEIAGMLGTKTGTVRNQISTILQKLDVPNRVQAILCAAQLGLL